MKNKLWFLWISTIIVGFTVFLSVEYLSARQTPAKAADPCADSAKSDPLATRSPGESRGRDAAPRSNEDG